MLPNLVDSSSLKNKIILRVFNILLSITIACLTTFNTLKNYAGKSQSHKEAGEQFSRIHSILKQELLYYPKDRHHATEFIQYQSQILDIYIANSPNIEDKVIKIFKEKFKSLKIDIPKLMSDDISQFNIIISHENKEEPYRIREESFKNRKGILDSFSNSVSPLRNNTQINTNEIDVPIIVKEVGSEPKIDIEENKGDTENIKLNKQNYIGKFRIEMDKYNNY